MDDRDSRGGPGSCSPGAGGEPMLSCREDSETVCGRVGQFVGMQRYKELVTGRYGDVECLKNVRDEIAQEN